MFACRFIPTGGDDIDDSPEVIWEKGDVDDLVWEDVLWITPIEFTGERAYRRAINSETQSTIFRTSWTTGNSSTTPMPGNCSWCWRRQTAIGRTDTTRGMMATKFFKDLRWYLSEGWATAVTRWAEGVSARNNAYRPVSKIKNTPVSGDALAWYGKEWRKHDG